jgi:hypothetical protein
MKALYILFCLIALVVIASSLPFTPVTIGIILILLILAIGGYIKIMCNEAYELKYEDFRWKTTGRLGRWFQNNFSVIDDQTDPNVLKSIELEQASIPSLDELQEALPAELQFEFQTLREKIGELHRKGIYAGDTEWMTSDEIELFARYDTLYKIAVEALEPRPAITRYRDLSLEQWRAVKADRTSRRASLLDDYQNFRSGSW